MLSTVVLVSAQYIGTYDTRCSRASWVTSLPCPARLGQTALGWGGPQGYANTDSYSHAWHLCPCVHRRHDGVACPRLRPPQASLRQLSALPAARPRPQAHLHVCFDAKSTAATASAALAHLPGCCSSRGLRLRLQHVSRPSHCPGDVIAAS